MNEYPEELRNPVIPVVALVGLPANHQIIEKNVVTKTLYLLLIFCSYSCYI